jgi:pyruvate formate lyase activating enzyme
VTNGYISPEALELLLPYLDVYRVDIKGFSRASYGRIAHISDPGPVLQAVKRAGEYGVHIELVTNVIPGYNDSELEDIAHWIYQGLGPFVPWHITRFFPHLYLSHLPPTPLSLLEKARLKALELGLKYVYLGNLPGHPGENTYCHHCGRLLIKREVFTVKVYHLKGNTCPHCGTLIPGRFSG